MHSSLARALSFTIFYLAPLNSIIIYVKFKCCINPKLVEDISGYDHPQKLIRSWRRTLPSVSQPGWSQLCDPGMRNSLRVTEAHRSPNPPAAWPDTHTDTCCQMVVDSHVITNTSMFAYIQCFHSLRSKGFNQCPLLVLPDFRSNCLKPATLSLLGVQSVIGMSSTICQSTYQ